VDNFQNETLSLDILSCQDRHFVKKASAVQAIFGNGGDRSGLIGDAVIG
jgi:hypothetical protein